MSEVATTSSMSKRKPREKSIEELLLEEQGQQDEMIRVATEVGRYMKMWRQQQITPANERRKQDKL
jgi:hypothetical protein